MTDKCNKYESYFVFAKEDDFQNHLANCKDCQIEQSNQQKVSCLVKEVKDIYLKKEKSNYVGKIVAGFLMLTVLAGSIIPVSIDNHILSELKYSAQGYYYEIGMPVDEYGLINI